MGTLLQLSKNSSGTGQSYPLSVLLKISKRGEKCYLTMGIVQNTTRKPP